MPDERDKKTEKNSELDLIKSVLNADLDETTVDIFAQDLFAKPEPEKKKPAEIEKPVLSAPEQKETELRPVEAEEIKLPSPRADETQKAEKISPVLIQKKSLATAEKARKTEFKTTPQTKPSFDEKAIQKEPAPEVELKFEAGDLHSVAAVKEEEKLDQTSEMLMQLEKLGDDFLSADEMRKLFANVNLMIELLNKTLARIEQLERKLKEKGIF